MVDVLADRLHDNATANENPHVKAFHAEVSHAGCTFLVTAWSIEQTGGPACYPGRDMRESHKEFMDIIESYLAMVVGPPGDKREIDLQESVPA